MKITLLFVQSEIMMKTTRTNNPLKLMKLNLVIILIILMMSCDRRSKLKVDRDEMMLASQASAVGNGDASSLPLTEAA